MERGHEELRNLRDFLLVYNKMTELCFSRCAKNLNYRSLTMEEVTSPHIWERITQERIHLCAKSGTRGVLLPENEQCLDSCASKLIRSNHRIMGAYVGLMPSVVQRRMADLENQSKMLEEAATSSEETASALPIDTNDTPVPNMDSVPEGQLAR